MKQIRITTGTAKNKRLKAPNVEGFRAVQEIAKLSVFSIIGDKILDSKCLDLYTGSGNIGIEALSRGAEQCDFVDEEPNAIRTVEENLKNCNLLEKATLHRQDVVKFVANTEKKFDLIFVDPFYDDINHIFLMQNLEEILEEEGIIIFFHGEQLDINKILKNTKLKSIDERKFGKSFFNLIKR